jgi:hypothetical protein
VRHTCRTQNPTSANQTLSMLLVSSHLHHTISHNSTQFHIMPHNTRQYQTVPLTASRNWHRPSKSEILWIDNQACWIFQRSFRDHSDE